MMFRRQCRPCTNTSLKREAQLPPQEIEEAPVPQLLPSALRVEAREHDEELGEGVVLAAEEVGEAGGLFTSCCHARRVSRAVEAS